MELNGSPLNQSEIRFFEGLQVHITVKAVWSCVPIASGVFVVPLFSWYNPEFDTEDPLLVGKWRAIQCSALFLFVSLRFYVSFQREVS